MQVDLARVTVGHVSHGRAASRAEIAPDAWGGLVNGGLAFQVAELIELDAHIRGNGRRSRAPAALTVAVHDPLGLAVELIGDGPAQAMPSCRHSRAPELRCRRATYTRGRGAKVFVCDRVVMREGNAGWRFPVEEPPADSACIEH